MPGIKDLQFREFQGDLLPVPIVLLYEHLRELWAAPLVIDLPLKKAVSDTECAAVGVEKEARSRPMQGLHL